MNEIVKLRDELRQLLDGTDKVKPTPEALQALRQYFVKNPNACHALGDLASQVTTQIVDHALPEKTLAAAALKSYMESLRDDLGYKDGAPIEKMLIENIIICWLRLHVTELRYESTMEANITMTHGRYWEDKLTTHQKRYLRAVETLARVRRLQKEPKSPAFNLLLAQQITNHR